MNDQNAQMTVYVKDVTCGWILARPLPKAKSNDDNDNDIVSVICENGDARSVNLKEYGPTYNLPLRVQHQHVKECHDLRNLPYIHEPSVLYNIKERYEEHDLIYTRANDRVLVAVNPYRWIEGMYSADKRILYAERFVWKQHDSVLSNMSLPPHLYELSSLAMKAIQKGGRDQTIIVSGESGSGKTVASKILMTHLATFHELQEAYIAKTPEDEGTEDEKSNSNRSLGNKIDGAHAKYRGVRDKIDHIISFFQIRKGDVGEKVEEFDIKAPTVVETIEEEPEEMKQSNIIVQRVLDANPLLEAFGNAKTQWNENSSRFSRHSKLQFHVENSREGDQTTCNLAGSICETFLLEKSRVVGRDGGSKERNFHIFHQLLAAPENDKEKVWKGLVGKTGSCFNCVGMNPDVDSYTNENAWKTTISALHTVDVHGQALQCLLRALCIVMQLGNITFHMDPKNPEGSIVSSKEELDSLAELLGVGSNEIEHSLTSKTVTAVYDKYEVPLKASDAKATCNAFAKEMYADLFDWLVQRINEATSAKKNYMYASEDTTYQNIAALDLFGFENHERNGFEKLLINHANERLQKSFTDDFIDSIMKEYKSEGIQLDEILNGYKNNNAIIDLLEGKMGLVALLNEECIRPQGSDSGFVNKIYASHSSRSKGSALIKKKYYGFSATLFGINHFAGEVDYDGLGFVEKNRDTLGEDVLLLAGKSTNHIVSSFSHSYQRISKRKGNLVGTSLWTKFGRQMRELFKELERTRTTYVRCILPNSQQEPGKLDNLCIINQFRSIGLLTALHISNTYTDKHKLDDIMQRFWPVMSRRPDLRSLWKKYKSAPESQTNDARADFGTILTRILGKDGENESFAVGRSQVYFRSGGLERLEDELAKTYNLSAARIQGLARGYLTRIYLKEIGIRNSSGVRFAYHEMKRMFSPILSLPLSVCRLLIDLIRPSPPMIGQ